MEPIALDLDLDEEEINPTIQPKQPQTKQESEENISQTPIAEVIDETTSIPIFRPKTLTSELLTPLGHMLVLGQTMSGKTSLIRNIILSYYRKQDCNIIGCYWFGLTANQETYIKPQRRREKINMEMLKKLYDNMLKIKNSPGGANKRIIVVLDDIIGENTHQNPLMDQWIATSRHANIICIVSIQKMTKISPTIRENVQRVFLVHTNKKSMKLLYELTTGDLNYNEWTIAVRSNLGKEIEGKRCCTLLDFRPNVQEVTSIKTTYRTPEDLMQFRFNFN